MDGKKRQKKNHPNSFELKVMAMDSGLVWIEKSFKLMTFNEKVILMSHIYHSNTEMK